MLNIIIFGAPGSGKGTQSEFLKEHFNLEHISTGDMLREEIKNGTEKGKIAQALIDDGHLVPDELIIDMLNDRLNHLCTTCNKNGVIYDGFPRTVIQAKVLDEMMAKRGQVITALVNLEVEEEELIKRIINRGKSSGRADDNEEAVIERLKVYHQSTEPVLDYYRNSGKLLNILGSGEISEITDRIIKALEGFK